MSDPVQTNLLALIEEKKKALRPKKLVRKKDTAEPSHGGKVVSIMDALRASLAQGKSRKAV